MTLKVMTKSVNTTNNHFELTQSAAKHFSSLLQGKENQNIRIGTTIDYVKEGVNSNLSFINPNVSAQCGCGESFSI